MKNTSQMKLELHEKKYIKAYVKQNLRLIIVTVIILTLLVSNLLLPIEPTSIVFNFLEASIGAYNPFGEFFAPLLLCVCILAFIMPIYQFRFLHKRSSSDLYLSLPIQRKRLFTLHYGIGAIFLVLVSLFEGIIVSINVITHAPSRYGFGIEPQSLNYILVIVIIFILLGLCLYTIFTFLVLKCNTMLDTIVVCSLYTILPMLLFRVVQLFLTSIGNQVLVANGFQFEIISDVANYLVSFFSIPWLMRYWVLYFGGTCPSGMSLGLLVIYTCIWIVIAISCVAFMKKHIVKYHSETCEQATTSPITYPFLIPAFTFFGLLMFGLGRSNWIPALCLLIAYLLAHFLFARNIHVNRSIFAIFAGIYLVANGMYLIGVNTNLFGNFTEIPNSEHIDDIYLTVNTNRVVGNKLAYSVMQEKLYATDDNQFDRRPYTQEELSVILKDIGEFLPTVKKEDTTWYCKMDLSVVYIQNDQTIARYDYCFNSDSNMNKLSELRKQWEDEGIISLVYDYTK